eukprot:TRINITY_DN39608_c0_g1_i2.p1 TRINITY_DN39608_c0_g1~~TRINITY_DN39608_c0_g1_i2.p1  ORF type:complete len:142 (-),score=6.96 TRINITY_DN39608_c0_g1_i2:208-576(-)
MYNNHCTNTLMLFSMAHQSKKQKKKKKKKKTTKHIAKLFKINNYLKQQYHYLLDKNVKQQQYCKYIHPERPYSNHREKTNHLKNIKRKIQSLQYYNTNTKLKNIRYIFLLNIASYVIFRQNL